MLTVNGSALVGRTPSPAPGEIVDTLFSIDDPTRSVSRTHFRADWRNGHLTVTDRGSANGLVIVGGQPLPPVSPSSSTAATASSSATSRSPCRSRHERHAE
jgi:predicted component of type VI protein secretion system